MDNNTTDATEKGKLIFLPPPVMDALKVDAKRCRRTLMRHIEAILIAYLDVADVNLPEISGVRTAARKGTPGADEATQQEEVPAAEAEKIIEDDKKKHGRGDKKRKGERPRQ